MMVSVNDALEQIKHGADEILVESELKTKLERGKPLRIKAGFDQIGRASGRERV